MSVKINKKFKKVLKKEIAVYVIKRWKINIREKRIWLLKKGLPKKQSGYFYANVGFMNLEAFYLNENVNEIEILSRTDDGTFLCRINSNNMNSDWQSGLNIEFLLEYLKSANIEISDLSSSNYSAYMGMELGELTGFHFSQGKTDSDNKKLALFECIERLSSRNVVGKLALKENTLPTLSLNDLGFSWISIRQKDSSLKYTIGKSAITGEKYKIPASVVYYGAGIHDCCSTLGSSNGCAVGESVLSAKYSALVEYVERDAFLKYWIYNPKGIIEIIPKLIFNNNYLSTYLRDLSIDADFFLINDNPLYVVWCVLREKGENSVMFSMSGLAASFDIKKAEMHAFNEAISAWSVRQNQLQQLNKEKVSKGILDKQLDFYADVKNAELINKLISTDYKQSEMDFTFENKDLSSLDNLLDVCKKKYRDLVFVDQTSLALKRIGLYCFKCFCVGGLNMAYGQNYILSENAQNHPKLFPIA